MAARTRWRRRLAVDAEITRLDLIWEVSPSGPGAESPASGAGDAAAG